jgi:ParB family chromosome partitioning protein
LAGCSERLAKRLAAHHTTALQVVLLSRNTTAALASRANVSVQRVFGGECRRASSALQVSPQLSPYALEAVAGDLKGSAAWQAIDAKKQGWMARLPEWPGAWMEWPIGLLQAELMDLLALRAAMTLNAPASAGCTRRCGDRQVEPITRAE